MSNQEKAIAVVERLNEEYERAVGALRTALKAYLETGARPDPQQRFDGTFAYPELRLIYDPEALPPKLARSYARVSRPGVYATTVTKPAQFKDYLVEQLTLLLNDFDVEIEVDSSRRKSPIRTCWTPAST
jgi:AMP nucleosidase